MYNAIRANKRNTVIIMAVFLLLIGGIGALIGYANNNYSLTVVVLAVALVYAVIEYFIAGRLAIMTSSGKEIQKRDNPELWNTVENLSIASGLPMPRVFVINDPAPNAFATGRDPQHAYVAVTTGLLEIMDKRELNGVLAHEMSHIANYDIRVSMIVFGLVSAIGLLADLCWRIGFSRDKDSRDSSGVGIIVLLLVAILSPIMAAMIQLAVSRQREYLADSSAALLTRDPEGLEMALAKLEQQARPLRKQSPATAHMYIANPLRKGLFNNLFSTHPSTADRIARLKKMESRM